MAYPIWLVHSIFYETIHIKFCYCQFLRSLIMNWPKNFENLKWIRKYLSFTETSKSRTATANYEPIHNKIIWIKQKTQNSVSISKLTLVLINRLVWVCWLGTACRILIKQNGVSVIYSIQAIIYKLPLEKGLD